MGIPVAAFDGGAFILSLIHARSTPARIFARSSNMSGTVAKSSSTATKSSKYVYRSSGGNTADVSIEYTTDPTALTRLEDKIRLVQEDLETERELRQRVERDKADLSVQVIQLQDRLEEAETGCEQQLEVNRKRDCELAKLRKLLEDVHMESEETAHMLRKKHQEAVVDLQDQLELLAKAKAKSEKEKAKFQQELYELLAQVDSANKDKSVFQKEVSKLEVTVHEYSIKVEELNRTIIDITSLKTRISQENIELTKEVQELKVSYENVVYLRNQVSPQYDDLRRRFEDEERRRSSLESSLHSVEVELESVRVQLEEEAEARLDLERQLSKANQDVMTWKSKSTPSSPSAPDWRSRNRVCRVKSRSSSSTWKSRTLWPAICKNAASIWNASTRT